MEAASSFSDGPGFVKLESYRGFVRLTGKAMI